jgi:hypothetical protein
MKRLLAAAALIASAPAMAQATFITMGRLFTTPVERTQLDQQRNSTDSATLLEGRATMAPPPPSPPAMAASPIEAAPPAAPQVLQLNGVLRRSNGKTIVWVNNEPQESAPSARGPAVPLDLGGRKVILKPGQSYDPATGAIQESGR